MIFALLIIIYLWLAPATIFNTVADALGGAFHSVTDLAHAAWRAIRGVWSILAGVFGHVGHSWGVLYGALHRLVLHAAELGEHVAGFARHVLETVIPGAAHWALREATHVASVLVSRVRSELRGLLSSVRRSLESLVHSVWVRLTHWVRSIERTVIWVWNWLTHGAIKAVDIVLHPTHLAAWVAPHLLGPLLRFLRANLRAVARLIWRQIRGHEAALAHDLEDAIVHLLS